jgi:hypothetical protein
MSVIVCIKDADTLVLATDSRLMDPDLVGIASDSMQKIFEIGAQMLLAPIGWKMATDYQAERARELVATLGTADIRIVSEALARESIPQLESLVEMLRSNPHEKIQRAIDGQLKLHITVLVGRTAHGALGYISQAYRVQAGRVVCEMDEYFGREGKLCTSGGDQAVQVMTEDPTILLGAPVDIARKLLAGLKRVCPTIGGADQVVRVDDDGTHWISRRPSQGLESPSQGLENASVIDSNVVSVGINKVTYGTSIFAGDVVLSRGISLPVIVLSNTALTLFGQADASTGATGLTSHPYVAIQSAGISLFSGGNPSVTVTSSSVTLWGVNGNTGYPYLSLASSALTITAGSFTNTTSASQITLAYSGGASLTLNSAVVKILNGTYSVVLSASSIYLYSIDGNTGYPYVSITSGGLTIVGGSLTSPTISGGSLSITTASGTLTVNSGTTGVQITGGTTTLTISQVGIYMNQGGSVASWDAISITQGGTRLWNGTDWSGGVYTSIRITCGAVSATSFSLSGVDINQGLVSSNHTATPITPVWVGWIPAYTAGGAYLGKVLYC